MEIPRQLLLRYGRDPALLREKLNTPQYDLFANDNAVWKSIDMSQIRQGGEELFDTAMTNIREYMDENGLLVDYSDAGLDMIADRAASEGEKSDIIIIPGGLPDVRPLLRKGFWPTQIQDYDYYTYLYLQYGDHPDLPDTVREHIRKLRRASCWQFTPVGILREEALEDAGGFQLGIIAPDLVYPSGRPRTDMALFRNANSNRLPLDKIANNECTIEGVEWKVIPVTRYATGMTRSLFYGDTPSDKSYCGTFYYGEKSSSTYLAYKKALVAFNKTDAMSKLLGSREAFFASNLYKLMNPDAVAYLLQHIDGEIPRDLRIKSNTIEYYGGDDLERNLYAAEDNLDQPLCSMAAKRGYDIVILENMVGSFQVVTEVLDVRSRHDSFLSLIYTY